MDCYSYLQSLPTDSADRVAASIWAWWFSNDFYRDKTDSDKISFIQRSVVWNENVEYVSISMRSVVESHIIVSMPFFTGFSYVQMWADSLRQIGMFNQAIQVLEASDMYHNHALGPLVRRSMRTLCDDQNPLVQQI
jgi:hypothetical protein